MGLVMHRALVNGTPGVVATLDGRPFAVGGFNVANGKIVEIDILADQERLERLNIAILQAGTSDD
jgi:RNA polymerase sigma-70 factor (ECF subfamily)